MTNQTDQLLVQMLQAEWQLLQASLQTLIQSVVITCSHNFLVERKWITT